MTIVNIRPGARLKVASRGVTLDELDALLATKQNAHAQLTGLSQPIGTGLVEKITSSDYLARALGVGAATSVPTRADADARYALIADSFTGADQAKLDGIEALADVTDAGNVGAAIHGASGKTTPVDADTIPLIDSAASNVLKKLTWANLKAWLNTFYQPIDAVLTATTASFTTAKDTKLSGIATGATANDTDAALRARASHTGTQDPATILFAATDKLVGRDAAAGGVATEISVAGGLEFTGANGIQRSALTGAVTSPAGSGVTTIAANVIVTTMIVNDAVTAPKIAAGAVGASELAVDSVWSTNIINFAVTEAKLAGLSVTATKIANDAVNSNKILDANVLNSKLANMGDATFKMRALGAGAGVPIDGTATQARTALNVENGADVTDAGNVGSSIAGAAQKLTLADDDAFAVLDSAALNVLKRVTWFDLTTVLDAMYLTPVADEDYALAFRDEAGNIAGGINYEGRLDIDLEHPELTPLIDTDFVLAFSDAAGNVAGGINFKGRLDIDLENPELVPVADADYVLPFGDEAGNIAGGIRHDGKLDIDLHYDYWAYTRGLEGSREAYVWTDGSGEVQISYASQGDVIGLYSQGHSVDLLFDLTGLIYLRHIDLRTPAAISAAILNLWAIPLTGQSNAHGTATPPLVMTSTPVDPGRALMPSGGVRTLQNSHNNVPDAVMGDAAVLDWADLLEEVDGVAGETVASMMAAAILLDAPATTGVIVEAHSVGSVGYALVEKGTQAYANMMKGMRRAKLLADLNGTNLTVPAVVWVGGESDSANTQAAYLVKMQDYQNDLDLDMKEITGQGGEVIVVMPQMSVGMQRGVPLAMLQAAIDEPGKFICPCPRYHLPYSDTVHHTSVGHAWLGAYIGRAINRKLVDLVDPIPLHLVSAVRTAASVVLTFDGDVVPPVEFDTTIVTDPGHYGIEWLDAGDGNSVTITGQTITADMQITITLSATPTGTNQRVGIAYTGGASGGGPVVGPRSCIRDQWPETVEIDGDTYDLHNYCAHSLVSVT